MSKKQIKKIIFMGVGCALLLIVGTIYSLLYNDGRWVKNMDMSEYVFSYKDIPMLVIGALIALYAIYIVIICFKNVFSKNSREKRYSRTISPYWGFCGMFGFLGFGGFWTYYKFGEIFPFAFFIFFGFFSFFFEGKLSHILEDELFQENKRKAQLEAYKIGFKLLFVVIWLMAIGMFSRNVEWCAIFMLISVSLIYALVLFLSNYLLYRYEKRKQIMEAKFVCNLKKYRVAQELTQEQLADIVGVRRETIMRLEKAQYNPSLKLAIDISRAVKAPIEDIFIFE